MDIMLSPDAYKDMTDEQLQHLHDQFNDFIDNIEAEMQARIAKHLDDVYDGLQKALDEYFKECAYLALYFDDRDEMPLARNEIVIDREKRRINIHYLKGANNR